MCICQLFYQFYLYPRLGPPLGKFNHLQMFRLGCFLYIPAYLCLPLLRSVASPDSDGGILVMTRTCFPFCWMWLTCSTHYHYGCQVLRWYTRLYCCYDLDRMSRLSATTDGRTQCPLPMLLDSQMVSLRVQSRSPDSSDQSSVVL
jgi:hypothetical protein